LVVTVTAASAIDYAARSGSARFPAGHRGIYTEMATGLAELFQSGGRSYNSWFTNTQPAEYARMQSCAVAKLQREQLGIRRWRKKRNERVSEALSRSPRKREVQEALAELAAAAEQRCAGCGEQCSCQLKRGGTKHRGAGERARPNARAAKDRGKIRASAANSPGGERRRDADKPSILEDSVQYTSRRITNPDRIFFDCACGAADAGR